MRIVKYLIENLKLLKTKRIKKERSEREREKELARKQLIDFHYEVHKMS